MSDLTYSWSNNWHALPDPNPTYGIHDGTVRVMWKSFQLTLPPEAAREMAKQLNKMADLAELSEG